MNTKQRVEVTKEDDVTISTPNHGVPVRLLIVFQPFLRWCGDKLAKAEERV